MPNPFAGFHDRNVNERVTAVIEQGRREGAPTQPGSLGHFLGELLSVVIMFLPLI